MGIAIPDEFRPDMAMAGEWEVTSERILEPEGEKKPDAIALGVRKREPTDEDKEELEAKKRRWGNAHRTHPTDEGNGDLDALLNNAIGKGKTLAVKTEVKDEGTKDIKEEPGASADKVPGLKREPSDGDELLPAALPPFEEAAKQEGEEGGTPGVVFKKRKAKNIRQK